MRLPLIYYPLIFGVVLSLLNIKEHRFNPIFVLILAIAGSYLSYFGGLYMMDPVYNFLRIFGLNSADFLALQSGINIIPPIILFISYSYIFKVDRDKTTILIFLFSIILLIILNNLFDGSSSNPPRKPKPYLPFLIWPVIVSIGFQVALYWKKLTRDLHQISIF
ncbi:hypothetical protein ML462_06105 [Gramella lutea]|uniref:Uncharacterized protein n=1 Tax=Christiangramia lutea TaxID=1607951 RepID=A0A9X1V1Q3_9FLAO|nr:hypothetical protein [Christiangramia lutea]MCH4822742.1 hypothetical protein [Christiangramia lutea]